MSDSQAATGSPGVRLTLVAEHQHAVGYSAFRRQVRAYLASSGVVEHRIADVVLVLSELLTNAVEASPAAGRVEVAVEASAGAIRLDVTNEVVPTMPVRWPLLAPVVMPTPLAERGRGLPLVAALATRMSIDVGDRETHVRAELLG